MPPLLPTPTNAGTNGARGPMGADLFAFLRQDGAYDARGPMGANNRGTHSALNS